MVDPRRHLLVEKWTRVRQVKQINLKSLGIARKFGSEAMEIEETRKKAEFQLQVKHREIP